MGSLIDRYRNQKARVFLGVYFSLFLIIPLFFALKEVLVNWDFSQLTLVFVKLLLMTLARSALQAALSASLSCFIGISLGLILAFAKLNFKNTLAVVIDRFGILLFSLPGVAVALFVLFVSRQISETAFVGLFPIVMAHVFMNYFMITSTTHQTLKSWIEVGGHEQLESAQLLGATRVQSILTLVKPLLCSEVRQWWPLVFLYSTAAFATSLVLGGGPQYSTPEVLLFYSLLSDSSQSRIFLTALFQFFVTSMLMVFVFKSRKKKISRSAPIFLKHMNPILEKTFTKKSYEISPFWMIFPLIFVLPPLLFLLWPPWLLVREFLKRDLWNQINPDLFLATLESLLLALTTGFVAIGVYYCLLSVESRFRKSVSLCLGFSSSLFVFSWMAIASEFSIDQFFAHRSWLQFAFLATVLPFLLAPLISFWIQERIDEIPEEQIAAASLLGLPQKSFGRAFLRPKFRDIEQRVFTSALLMSLGEIAVASFFAPNLKLLPVLSSQMAGRYDFIGSYWILSCYSLMTLFLLFVSTASKIWLR